MAGLAGAQLSIGIVGVFSVGISAGRGFIALAAFYFGRNRPGLTAAGRLAVRLVRRDPDQSSGSRRRASTGADAALYRCDRGFDGAIHRRASPAVLCVECERVSSSDSTALILVDVTNSFYLKGMPNFYPDAEQTLEPLRRLLEAARANQRIVVHAAEQHRAGFDDYEWKKLPKHHFIGEVDGAFFPGFEPEGPREFLLPKRRYSAFFATDLAMFLQRTEDRARRGRRRKDQCVYPCDRAGRFR